MGLNYIEFTQIKLKKKKKMDPSYSQESITNSKRNALPTMKIETSQAFPTQKCAYKLLV